MGGSTDVVLKPELEQILSGYVSIRKRILSANIILIKIHCIVHIDAFIMIWQGSLQWSETYLVSCSQSL